MAKTTPCIIWCYGLRSLNIYAYYHPSMKSAKEDMEGGCFGDAWRIIRNPSPQLTDYVKVNKTLPKDWQRLLVKG